MSYEESPRGGGGKKIRKRIRQGESLRERINGITEGNLLGKTIRVKDCRAMGHYLGEGKIGVKERFSTVKGGS